jgi:DGQHR domain-containing protein
MASKTIEFNVLVANQSKSASVFCFVTNVQEIEKVARIERAGRSVMGKLTGFQRNQIAGHIREIRDYLGKPNAILPNALILGFTDKAKLDVGKNGVGTLTVDVSRGAPGWIVDGQQRFTALGEVNNPDFQVMVAGFICSSQKELNTQFILINNTKPLPRELVFELAAYLDGLPVRMSNSQRATKVAEMLNVSQNSSLYGLIKGYTSPNGVINASMVRKLVMNSIADGELRLYARDDRRLIEQGTSLISEFFYAVQHVFREDWEGHTQNTSRLLHGAGIVAMGYAMETLITMTGARNRTQFADGLRHLKGKTAWTQGKWYFKDEVRNWNGPQNVSQDVRQLSLYLMQELKRGIKGSSKKVKNVRR